MIHGIILTDNTYNDNDHTVNRASGAHRIAHYLRKQGYFIEVIDYVLRWQRHELNRLLDKLVTPDLLFLGIGSNLFLDRADFDDTVCWIKKKYPKIPIILGGTNLLARSIPDIDYYVEGYAERSMLELMLVLQGRKTVETLKFSDFAPDRRLIDSNKDYPVHDTSDLSIDYLPTDFINSNQTLGIETARGCIFKCSFCTYPLIGKKKIDYVRDEYNIINEIKKNYDLWGTTRYVINEDTFNDRIEKLEILADAISNLPFKIEVVTYARLDLILSQKKSIEFLRTIGLKGVHFGIDTFNPKAGKLIGKGINGDRIKDGLMWWQESMPEVSTYCSVIVGLPDDDDDLFQHNEWFVNSGIQSWTWVPLYITDMSKTLHLSEFSKNYKKYGLDVMTDSEINYYHDQEEKTGISKNRHQTYASRALRQKMILWKNIKTGENYFTAVQLAQQLNDQAKSRRVSPWLAFDWASLGYSLEVIRKWGWHQVVPHVPMQEINEKIQKHIENYINKKIDFDYRSYYLSVKPKKTIDIKSVYL